MLKSDLNILSPKMEWGFEKDRRGSFLITNRNPYIRYFGDGFLLSLLPGQMTSEGLQNVATNRLSFEHWNFNWNLDFKWMKLKRNVNFTSVSRYVQLH